MSLAREVWKLPNFDRILINFWTTLEILFNTSDTKKYVIVDHDL